jgi:Na+/melibiose symporter-like transporter
MHSLDDSPGKVPSALDAASRRAKASRLPAWRVAAFAAPCVPIAALGLPISLYLPQFYASEMGLGLGVVGTIFMVARLWDVITDPMVGVVSDHYPSRWGHRRHWLVMAMPVICIATYFLFLPQAPVSPFYLLGWLLLLYLGWTMFTIPHLSWGAELSDDYHERSRIHGYREAAEIIGVPLVLAAPAAIERMGGPEMEANRVAAMGLFIILLLPIATLFSVWLVKERPVTSQPRLGLRVALKTIARNRPLRTLVAADAISGSAGAAVGALFLYVATHRWGLEDAASLLMLIYFFAGLGFVPLVLQASYRFGKQRTLIGCCTFYVIGPPFALLVPQGNMAAAAALMILLGVNVGGAGVLFRSIMADVADLDELESGQKRTGLLYSFLALTRKAGSAFAVGATFWALQLIGFKPDSLNANPVVMKLALLFAITPMVCNLAVILLMWRFPLGAEAHAAIQRELGKRQAVTPSTGNTAERTPVT